MGYLNNLFTTSVTESQRGVTGSLLVVNRSKYHVAAGCGWVELVSSLVWPRDKWGNIIETTVSLINYNLCFETQSLKSVAGLGISGVKCVKY